MRQLFAAIAVCLMLIIGLKDGRVAKIDGFPIIRFDAIMIDGQKVECALIIIEGKAYPIPVSLLEGMVFVPDDKAM